MNDSKSISTQRPLQNSSRYSSQIGVKSSKPQHKQILMTFIPKDTPIISSQPTNDETNEEENCSNSNESSSSSRKSSESISSQSEKQIIDIDEKEEPHCLPRCSKTHSTRINLLEENYDEIVNVILHSKKKLSANNMVANRKESQGEHEEKNSNNIIITNQDQDKDKASKFERAYMRQQSISPIDIINQHDDEVRGMTNTQEISNFYDYTKSCMKMILNISTIDYTHPAKVSFAFEKTNDVNKKLAVFDLDETLVHCLTKDFENVENIIEVPLPSKKTAKIGVLVRPHWKEAIHRIQKKYHIVIYTASHQSYADAVLNFLDPENKYFPFRLYRNNCIMVKNDNQIIYVKDCSIFNDYDLKDIVLVDNSVLSFAYHLDNGIPILPYYDTKVDFELLFCACYLESIFQYEDLRVGNKKLLKLDHFLCQAKEELEENKKEQRSKRKSKNLDDDQHQKEKEEKKKKRLDKKSKIKSNKDILKKRSSNFCLDFKYDLQELRNKFNAKEDKE